MKHRALALTALASLLALVILGCSLGSLGTARITPTPTRTPRPLFTSTPSPMPSPLPTSTQASTSIPLPSPASTLPPPTSTDTQVPPATLTQTVIPPTITPPPTATPIPATGSPTPPPPTARPKPTRTPKPPATPVPAAPEVDFRVADVIAFENGGLGPGGLRIIQFTVIDASGTPLDGIVLEEVIQPEHAQLITGDKGPGKAEFIMWDRDYQWKVVGNTSGESYASEVTHMLSILFGHAVWDDLIRGGVCPDVPACEALGKIHFSYNVTFQRTW